MAAWSREQKSGGLDAVAINASGCGTTIKDYGHMLQDTAQAGDAVRIASIARDVSEILPDLDFPDLPAKEIRIRIPRRPVHCSTAKK